MSIFDELGPQNRLQLMSFGRLLISPLFTAFKTIIFKVHVLELVSVPILAHTLIFECLGSFWGC